MLYFILRLIAVSLLFLLGHIAVRKTKKLNKKRTYIISLIMCVVIFFVSGSVPVENLFIDFKTPETVLKYSTINGFNSIDFTIEGESSSMVYCYKNKGNYAIHFVGKNDSGYKIMPKAKIKMEAVRADSKTVAFTYKVRGTADQFCSVTAEYSDILLFDKSGDNLNVDIKRDTTGSSWLYINGHNDGYYLLLDGQKVSLSN